MLKFCLLLFQLTNITFTVILSEPTTVAKMLFKLS